jgi:phosphoribosylformylglycinamidine synthase II
MVWTDEILLAHRLLREEYAAARSMLGRELTWPELGVLSALWSEHCSYKSSRAHLARLPSVGDRVVVGPGENAGAVSIGGGWCVVFKIESHNHPSFVDPFQGAATGVGGILRDVFTLGARPVALLNSLRFGEPEHPRTRELLRGVVDGIGAYANAFGVPTVGGEIAFDPGYNGNCLVNAVAVGVAREQDLVFGRADGVGNALIYAGAPTGRDGIHGASSASAEFDGDVGSRRSAMQIADPFRGKCLVEACLEALATGAVVGMQDMGAAGLTSSSVEMAFRSGTGLRIDLDRIPRAEAGLTPYDLLLSESQERMLLVVRAGAEAEVLRVFGKWELEASVIGAVTDDGVWRATAAGVEECALPTALLVDGAPRRPDTGLRAVGIPEPAMSAECADPGAEVLALLGSLDHASRHWVYSSFDTQIGTDTVAGPGGDAAVLRGKGLDVALAFTVDGNARHVEADPEEGSLGIFAEACRNLACVGAEPIAATDGLNFGSPDDPAVMAQLASVVDGLARGSRAFGVPVISGNVSLHNATGGRPIPPTPMLAVVGLLPAPPPRIRSCFARSGLEVAVVGPHPAHGVGASSWLWWRHRRREGRPPPVDTAGELALHERVRELVRDEFVEVAHDVADGGVAIALAEACVGGPDAPPMGLLGDLPGTGDVALRLFGEDHGRVVLAWCPSRTEEVLQRLDGLTISRVGVTGGERFVLRGLLDLPVARLREVWEEALPTWMASGAAQRGEQ